MRKIIFLAVIVSCLAVGFKFGETPQPSEPVLQQSTTNIGFEWAFGALVGKENTMVPIARDTVLKSGEEIKMMVKLTKDCYVYVIHQGPKGEITLLFPYNVQQFEKDYLTEKNYFVPKGRDWLKLDKTVGREKFFIIASAERLLDVEARIGEYLSADASKKEPLADSLISQIRDVRKRYSTFATVAEKPVTIGGNIRGTQKAENARRPDIAEIATKITANNFYSKTITIDHQ